MSVALVTMDSYALRLGIGHRRHHRHARMPSPDGGHVASSQRDHQPDQQPPDTETPLRFSVVNILRPEFGREAILNTKIGKANGGTVPAVQLATRHSPLALPRDLSLSSGTARLSPQSPQSTSYATSVHRERQQDTFSSHCGLASPLHRHTGLSRSGSLESLASSRSSIASSSVTSPPSLCSASSTIGSDSLNGDNNNTPGTSAGTSASQPNGTNSQSLWPAWVYCTRYSDRPSSGESNGTRFPLRLLSPRVVDLSVARSRFTFRIVIDIDQFSHNFPFARARAPASHDVSYVEKQTSWKFIRFLVRALRDSRLARARARRGISEVPVKTVLFARPCMQRRSGKIAIDR